jgi:2-polyprenyl-3-methyl-5-hydroxy-6-metoxy-1,4-benzoquinol methylase
MSTKDHWENIYATKELPKVSWYQPTPATSLRLVKSAVSKKDAEIIDIGGGDSFLIDKLLAEGYSNLTVLDISKNAIDRAKQRLGADSEKVNYVVSDIIDFNPENQFDIWHDRAAFHFLTDDEEIKRYIDIAKRAIKHGGNLIVGTFAEDGPDRCSGIRIKKYSSTDLIQLFSDEFDLVKGFNEKHNTPFNTTQNFTFIHLKKK